MKLASLTFSLILLSLVIGGLNGRRVHRARRNPKSSSQLRNVQGKSGLAEMLAGLLPNTYYSRPKYRFPYYNQDGKESYSSSESSPNHPCGSHQDRLISSLTYDILTAMLQEKGETYPTIVTAH